MVTNSRLVTIHPDSEKLKSDIGRIRTEISMLVLERDELLYVECRNLETAYMLAIGGLEYKAYEIECAILRMKRQVELLQAHINRQKKIDLPKIEETLNREFAEYQAKMNEQIEKMNAALEYGRGKKLTDEETRELKKLYLSIVRKLHPDLNPDSGKARIQLFQNAVEAYKRGDLDGLRAIGVMVAAPDSPAGEPDGLSKLAGEKERLSQLLQTVKDRIAKIKIEYPYTVKSLVRNPEKVKARQAEIDENIARLNDTLAGYAAKVTEMTRL